MIKFRVVTVTNNLEAYPQYSDDTEEFSELVRDIVDEAETFVVDTRDGGFWRAREFFDCVANVTHFLIDEEEIPEC